MFKDNDRKILDVSRSYGDSLPYARSNAKVYMYVIIHTSLQFPITYAIRQIRRSSRGSESRKRPNPRPRVMQFFKQLTRDSNHWQLCRTRFSHKNKNCRLIRYRVSSDLYPVYLSRRTFTLDRNNRSIFAKWNDGKIILDLSERVIPRIVKREQTNKEALSSFVNIIAGVPRGD